MMVMLLWFLSAIGSLTITVGIAMYVYLRRERTGNLKHTWKYIMGLFVVGGVMWYYIITTAFKTICQMPN